MNKKRSENCGRWSKWNISIPLDSVENSGSIETSEKVVLFSRTKCSLARGNYLLVLINDLVGG